MDDKLQEYVDVITSEKSGEEVRSAIEKAIIFLDADNAKIRMYNRTDEFVGALDDALSMLWEDVTRYFPNAVIPSYDPFYPDDPVDPLSDELEAILIELMNTINGSDIRSDIWAAFNIIYNDSYNHNIIRMRYDRILDLLRSAIDQSSALDDRKSRARASIIDCYTTQERTRHAMNYYSNASSSLSSLREARTGAIARPLIVDFVSNIDDANAKRTPDPITHIMYLAHAIEIVRSHSNDLEAVIEELVADELRSNYLCTIAVGGVDHTREDVEARKAQYEAIDTEDKFGIALHIHPVDDDHPDEYISDYYIELYIDLTGSGAMKYWTYAAAEAICSSKNATYWDEPILAWQFHPRYRA